MYKVAYELSSSWGPWNSSTLRCKTWVTDMLDQEHCKGKEVKSD